MSFSNKPRHYSDKKAVSDGSFIVKVPIVLLSMMLSGLLLLLISSYFALKTDSPLALTTPLSIISLYLCSFIGGAICAIVLRHSQSYLCALVSSTAFIIIELVLKAVVPRSATTPQIGVSALLHALIILSCISGVFFTLKIRVPNNKRHKQKNRR